MERSGDGAINQRLRVVVAVERMGGDAAMQARFDCEAVDLQINAADVKPSVRAATYTHGSASARRKNLGKLSTAAANGCPLLMRVLISGAKRLRSGRPLVSSMCSSALNLASVWSMVRTASTVSAAERGCQSSAIARESNAH